LNSCSQQRLTRVVAIHAYKSENALKEQSNSTINLDNLDCLISGDWPNLYYIII